MNELPKWAWIPAWVGGVNQTVCNYSFKDRKNSTSASRSARKHPPQWTTSSFGGVRLRVLDVEIFALDERAAMKLHKVSEAFVDVTSSVVTNSRGQSFYGVTAADLPCKMQSLALPKTVENLLVQFWPRMSASSFLKSLKTCFFWWCWVNPTRQCLMSISEQLVSVKNALSYLEEPVCSFNMHSSWGQNTSWGALPADQCSTGHFKHLQAAYFPLKIKKSKSL